MLFHIFSSQDERRAHNGSSFIELQFCRLIDGTPIDRLVSVDCTTHWLDDSLYADDENSFYERYSHIFDCGVYNNLESGTVDIYGINYYAPHLTELIIDRLRKEIPSPDHKLLISWLTEAKKYNGFYIMGI